MFPQDPTCVPLTNVPMGATWAGQQRNAYVGGQPTAPPMTIEQIREREILNAQRAAEAEARRIREQQRQQEETRREAAEQRRRAEERRRYRDALPGLLHAYLTGASDEAPACDLATFRGITHQLPYSVPRFSRRRGGWVVREISLEQIGPHPVEATTPGLIREARDKVGRTGARPVAEIQAVCDELNRLLDEVEQTVAAAGGSPRRIRRARRDLARSQRRAESRRRREITNAHHEVRATDREHRRRETNPAGAASPTDHT